jgi:hypothetical protein
MPKPTEIVAALGDVSAIESYATLQVEMVDLFTNMADGMKKQERPAQIMRKMAATVETIPYDVLAEFGHNYGSTLIAAFLLQWAWHDDPPDYADAHDLVLSLLDEFRRIDLDHPDTQKAIEQINAILESAGRPKPRAPRKRKNRA